jgi:hypothetical protein
MIFHCEKKTKRITYHFNICMWKRQFDTGMVNEHKNWKSLTRVFLNNEYTSAFTIFLVMNHRNAIHQDK